VTTNSGGAAAQAAGANKKLKAKKGGKETLVPNGAQIIDPANSSAPGKQAKKDKPDGNMPPQIKKGVA
jgi:hypothetical protein